MMMIMVVVVVVMMMMMMMKKKIYDVSGVHSNTGHVQTERK